MQLTIEREAILSKLENLQSIANTRTTLPILNNILIEATEADNEEEVSQVVLTANNLEIALGVTVPAIVLEAGVTTIPCRKFYEIVREIPIGYSFDLTVDAKNYIGIEYRGGQYKLRGLAPEEFPAQPPIEEANNKIEGLALQNLLENTLFAASLEEVRYYLNAVMFDLSPNSTTAVATDGRRLAVSTEEPVLESTEEDQVEDKDSEPTQFIVPLKTAREILKVFSSTKEVFFSVVKGQIALTDGDSVLTARLIEGNYPDYKRIVPEEQHHQIYVEKTALVSAVKRVSLLADPKNYSIQLTLDDKSLKLEVKTPDLGEANAIVDLREQFEGDQTVFKFDARLLIDGLSQIRTEYVQIDFNKSNEVVSLHPMDRETDPYFNLLMPIRLDTEMEEDNESDLGSDANVDLNEGSNEENEQSDIETEDSPIDPDSTSDDPEDPEF